MEVAQSIQPFDIGISFESNTIYIGDREEYHIYPSHAIETVNAWYTPANSDGNPLVAAFVFRHLENVTIDLRGAKLIFHGRMMPFAVFDCKNIRFQNFSIDYDRPFYTQGEVVAVDDGSVTIDIPEGFSYRIEGRDFVATSETWEHRLVKGDMLFRCFDRHTKLPSKHSEVILGLIGEQIEPGDNPPLPIHHLLAEQLEGRKVKISGLPEHFRPVVGEILAMTHEDRRKVGFLLERNEDTAFENIRLIHVSSYGILANFCHNITANNFSMYLDEQCAERVITINADSFHTFHSTGKLVIENCRFENMLDDAINIHGNYLICDRMQNSTTIRVINRTKSLRNMELLLPGDTIRILKGSTRELRGSNTVKSIAFEEGSTQYLRIQLDHPIPGVQEGDMIENRRTPEIEVRNCRVKCMGGFRIQSDRRVLIEDCYFETSAFSVLFSGDMNYWYENTGVKDVTIQNCYFKNCGIPIISDPIFTPTEEAPYYHENIRILNNVFDTYRDCVVNLRDTNQVEYRGNRYIQNQDYPKVAEEERIKLTRCSRIMIE